MDSQQHINQLENKINILSVDVQNLKKDYRNINNKLDKLVNHLIKRDKKEEKIKNKEFNENEELIIESFSDSSGNLNNERNPFIKSQNEILKNSESDSSNKKENDNKKRKKYAPRDPIYYYYTIKDKTYKYTCRNKFAKKILPFKCTDTSCKAKGTYNLLTEKFTPDNIEHIEYENHTYIIPALVKEKYYNNTFEEKDFENNLKIFRKLF